MGAGKIQRAFLAAGIIAVVAGSTSALELGADFRIGNLGFADDRAPTATGYPLLFPWGVSIFGSQAVNETLGVDIGFYMDPILNNVSYTLVSYRQDFFTIRVGPFFGFFNTPGSMLKPGISTSVRAEIPGVAFVEFRADSTIGGRLVQAGDYLQERSDVALGFYVPNAVCSVNLSTKNYTYRTVTREVVDNFVQYAFSTDVHKKNVPYRIQLDFGYQQRTRSYIDVSDRDTATHTLNSLIIGTSVDVEISDALTWVTALESSVFSYGNVDGKLLSLPSTGLEQYLFTVSTGFRLDISAVGPSTVY